MFQTPEMDDLVGDLMRQHIGGKEMETFMMKARIAVLERENQRLRNEVAELESQLKPPGDADGD